jgi:SpoVK/Ycf46/Vps4 family AAA+-type ATPase
LSRGVDSANDRYRLLGGILTILIGAGSIEKLSEHSRVILWIDEMENLIYFTSRYYLPFTQGLRELIDQIPNYFTLFMNITLASPEASKDIETILGKALMDRKTNEIYFKEPNEEEAYNYVIELLELYRTPEWKPKSLEPSHPFTKEALQILISSLKVRTPRDINQYCSDAITGALRDRVVGQNEQTITRQYIIDWIDKRTQQSL